MRPRWHARWRALALATDVVAVTAALVVWTLVRFGWSAIDDSFIPSTHRGFGRAPLAFAIPIWIVVYAALRLYSPQRCQNSFEEGRSLVIAGPSAAVSIVLLGFLVKDNAARSWLFGAMVFGTLAAAVGRQTLRSIVASLRQRGAWTTRTVVLGRREAKRIVEGFLQETSLGFEPVATCGFEWPGLPTFKTAEVAGAVRAQAAGALVVVAEGLERSEIRAALEVADSAPVSVIVLPGLDYLLLGSLRLVTVGNEPGLAVDAPSLRRYQADLKRAFDILASAALLLITAPVMLACALALRAESRGPVLFKQRREGLGGASFEVVKFRTMVAGVEPLEDQDLGEDHAFVPKRADDPRLTRVGRLLRRTSLDELPQLSNVLRGDMSLVGPRPLSLWEAERLALSRRSVVRPGLTGLWQVSGRSLLSPEERVRLDLVYVQNWSLLLDLSILLRTVPAVIGRRGAF